MLRAAGTLLSLILTVVLVSTADAGQRIVGGQEADWHAYPYFANVDFGLCSGSLIAPDRMLTAAHCLDHLRVGAVVKIDNGLITRRVVHLAQHPMLTKLTDGDIEFAPSAYDSAVLALDAPVTTVAPLRLATAADAGVYPAGTRVTTMGTGSAHYSGEGDGPFRTAQVQIRSDEDCTAMIKKERHAAYFKPGQMLCTTDPDTTEPWASACYGDSGSPLVATAPDGTAVQVGLDSWGVKCGEDNGGPEQYTDVAQISAFALDPNIQWRPEISGGLKLSGGSHLGSRVSCGKPTFRAPKPPTISYGVAYSASDGLYGFNYLRAHKLTLNRAYLGRRVTCYSYARNPGGPVINFGLRTITVRH